MASYIVQIPQDSLSKDRIAAVEEAVLLAHAQITGAPRYVTQVEVVEVDSGCFYFGGRLLECDRIFIHGVEVEDPEKNNKDSLVARITTDVAAAADYDPNSVFVTISEIPSEGMRVSARDSQLT
jgi:phenylpyruvate tautomerase PptA (4-oxalocrotonate tautomerase family)